MVRFPPNVNPLTARTTPSLAMPAYLTPGVDANTGASITRISSTSTPNTGMTTQYKRHMYSKVQPWSAKGKQLLLGMCYALMDGDSYAYIKDVSNNLPSHFLWSETDPLVGYGTASGNIFQQFTMGSESKTTIYTVSGATALSFGPYEGNFSADGRYIALVATISGNCWVYVYDMVGGTVAGSFNLGATAPDWVSMDQTGQYVVVNWATDGAGSKQGVEVYSKTGTFLRQIYTAGEHGDLGISAAGDAVYVTMAAASYAPSGIDMVRLSDGQRTMLFNNDVYNGHISCRNTLRPGWAYISTDNMSNADMPGRDEAWAIKLDNTQTVERFGHMHRTNAASIYEFQPHMVPNRDGSRVLFASAWDATPTNSTVYAFVLEMLREDAKGPSGPIGG